MKAHRRPSPLEPLPCNVCGVLIPYPGRGRPQTVCADPACKRAAARAYLRRHRQKNRQLDAGT